MTDLAVLANRRGAGWVVRPAATPVFEIAHADGTFSGQSYMEVWAAGARPVEGANKVRQTFTVSGADRFVAAVAVRVRRDGNPGPLRLRLEQADGTLLEEATIPASSVGATDTWISHAFAQAQLLEVGASYNVELGAPPGDPYQITPFADGGVHYGFRSGRRFAHGYAQFTSGNGWAGWTMWDRRDRKDGDLQLYFTPAEAP